jgi:hypothetical protein
VSRATRAGKAPANRIPASLHTVRVIVAVGRHLLATMGPEYFSHDPALVAGEALRLLDYPGFVPDCPVCERARDQLGAVIDAARAGGAA